MSTTPEKKPAKRSSKIKIDPNNRIVIKGARVVACCFLVDGDSRGQAGDLVDIGLFHLAKKLAGIAGKAFHIAALAVGVDRVKRQARLAGAGQAGHDDQLISGQLQIDVFQVMLPRSTVGTVTEIYDYLRLMYARIGVPHCPICGREITQQTVDEMVDEVMKLPGTGR